MAATQRLLPPSDGCDKASAGAQADFLKALSSSFFAEPVAAVRVPTSRQQTRLDERLTTLEGRASELETVLVQKVDSAAVEMRLEDASAAHEARVAQLQERIGAALDQRMEDVDRRTAEASVQVTAATAQLTEKLEQAVANFAAEQKKLLATMEHRLAEVADAAEAGRSSLDSKVAKIEAEAAAGEAARSSLDSKVAKVEAEAAQQSAENAAALDAKAAELMSVQEKQAAALTAAQQKTGEQLHAAASTNQAMLFEQLQMCSTTVEQRCAAIDSRFEVEHEQQKASLANFSAEMEQVLQMQSAAHSQAVSEASRRTTQANAQALKIQGDAQSKALREVSEDCHAALKAQAAEQRKALKDSSENADSTLRQVSDRLEAMLKASRQASQTGIEELTERLDALMLNLAEEIASCHEQVTKSQEELTKDLQARQEKLSEVLDESKRQFNSILDERVSEISSAAEGGRGFLAARIDETNDRVESMAGSMKSSRLMDLEDQVSLVTLGLKKKADKDDLEESATEFAEKIKTSEGSTNAVLEELRQKKADASKLDEHVAELAGNLKSRITDVELEKRLHDLTSQLTVVMDEQIDLAKESNRWKGVDDDIQSRKSEKLDSIAIDNRIKDNLEIRRLKDGLATTTKMITTLMSTLNAKDGAHR